MKPGCAITLRGKLGSDMSEVQREAKVISCLEQSDGTFKAGLEFLEIDAAQLLIDQPNDPPDESDGSQASQPLQVSEVDLDCYEVMQLSPNADSETVE